MTTTTKAKGKGKGTAAVPVAETAPAAVSGPGRVHFPDYGTSLPAGTLVHVLKPGNVNTAAGLLPAVWTDPAAGTASPDSHRPGDPAQSGGRLLNPDMLRGTPGNFVSLVGDGVISTGRWAARVSLFRPSERAILHDPAKLRRWTERTAAVLGLADRLDLVTVAGDSDSDGRVRGAVLSMLKARPGGRPVYRTGIVLDAPDVSAEHDDPSEFFRVYIGAGGVVVCLPDGYGEILGDPAALWPAECAGAWTDNVSVGVMAAGDVVRLRAVAVLDGWAANVRPDGMTAETAPAPSDDYLIVGTAPAPAAETAKRTGKPKPTGKRGGLSVVK
jgi:hypothetical protein